MTIYDCLIATTLFLISSVHWQVRVGVGCHDQRRMVTCRCTCMQTQVPWEVYLPICIVDSQSALFILPKYNSHVIVILSKVSFVNLDLATLSREMINV